MIRRDFEHIVLKVPHLTAEGLMDVSDPKFCAKRRDFVRSAVYLQQTNDAVSYLQGVGMSTRFSRWQRSHCTPQNIQALVEWWCGRTVSPGAIVVAGLHLGFTMGVQDGSHVYFNFLARQIETELTELARCQKIRNLVVA